MRGGDERPEDREQAGAVACSEEHTIQAEGRKKKEEKSCNSSVVCTCLIIIEKISITTRRLGGGGSSTLIFPETASGKKTGKINFGKSGFKKYSHIA